MESLLDQVKENRKQIKYDTITFSLSELVRMFNDKEIKIDPEYQRLFRWSRAQQSDFIESLILEIPVPPLFFFETDMGIWELLDGLQRLSTVIKFIGTDQDVPQEFQGQDKNEEDWHYDTQNDITIPLQLVGADYLSTLEGLSFARLPVPLQINLKRTRVQVYVLKRETHPSYKYEVFKRLNRSGSALSDQEVRNCSIRLLGNAFPEFINKLSADSNFVAALGFSNELIRQKEAEEYCVRYLAMKNYASNFKHDVAEFLTRYMEQVARGAIKFDYSEEETLFHRVWKAINEAMSNGIAFRGKDHEGKSFGPFSPTLFEMVSVAVALNITKAEALSPEDRASKISQLILQAKEDSLTGSGSNSKKKTSGRMDLARRWFA